MAERDVVMTAEGPTLPLLSEELESARNSVVIVEWRDRQGVIGLELPLQDVDHPDRADDEDPICDDARTLRQVAGVRSREWRAGALVVGLDLVLPIVLYYALRGQASVALLH